MAGQLVTNDKGEFALWDGQNLQPVQGQVVKNQAGEYGIWDGKNLSPVSGPSAAASSAPAQQAEKPMVAPVTAQPPRFPTLEKVMEKATIPLLTGAAGFLPGGPIIQAGIGAGGEALNELAQGESLDAKKIAEAAVVPGVARGLTNTARGVIRSVANQAARPQMVEAAIGKVEDAMGVGTRGTQAIEAAKKIATPVNAFPETENTIAALIQKESRIPGGSKDAVEIAKDTLDKLKAPGANLTYGEIMEATTALRATAEQSNSRTKALIYDIRDSLLKDIDKLGPEARDAFALYRKQESIKEVSKVFRTGGDRLSKFKNLLAEDPLVAGAFTDKEKKVLETISSHIGTEGFFKIAGALGLVGGAGYAAAGGEGAVLAAATPAIISAIMSHPAGQYLARGLIGPNGTVNKAVIPALAQFMRGQLAERGGEQPQGYRSPGTLEDYRSAN